MNRVALLVLAALLTSCEYAADVDGPHRDPPDDAGDIDSGIDAGELDLDAGGDDPDAGSHDAGALDAGPFDAGALDAGPFDAGPFDAGPFDAGPFDAGPFDAGPFDAGSVDGGSFDAGSHDAGSQDAGPPAEELLACSVLVAGGGLGGVAAAHEAASAGADTCVVESTAWLGGQATSQGVSALDEGFLDGTYPFSRTYADFRDRIRAKYRARYALTSATNEGAEPGTFDPGSCWVSRLCFEPKVGVEVIETDLLGPLVTRGKLRIRKGFSAIEVQRSGDRITGVLFAADDGRRLRVRADLTVDATELGDLFPLGGVAYRVGRDASADTGEPSAGAADAECVQPFTYTFALELMPEGQDHSIARPASYDATNFSLGQWRMFPAREPEWAFWNYRRLLHPPNFQAGVARDVAMINWGNPLGNDFGHPCGNDGCNVIDKPAAAQARIFGRGRERAREFLYWLQRDVPRDAGGRGYPNLKLRTDVMGTADGLSMYPYIRESRRLRALELVREQDAAGPSTDRGTLYDDTVGAGHYALDIHPCARGDVTLRTTSARALQVPLGALIPATVDGLLAGAKNVGVTHIANGAYRVHPVEWSIGQAAGALAAQAIRTGLQPRAIRANDTQLRRLQHALVTGRGGPLFWWTDLTSTHPAFVAAQMLGAARILVGTPGSLKFEPAGTVSRASAAIIVARTFGLAPVTACHASFTDVPCSHWAYFAVQALADRGITSGVGGGLFAPDDGIRRAHLATLFVRTAGWATPPATGGAFTDVSSAHPQAAFVEAAEEAGLFAGEASAGGPFAPDAIADRQAAARWAWNVLRSRWALP